MLEVAFGNSMESASEWYQGPARLLLAAILGAMPGFEREVKGRAAGIRTYALVSLGSAGFALIGMEALDHLLGHSAETSGHAIRLLSAVVGGVGFLGAGAIIQSGGRVRGLTTAAGMWVIAAVGVAAGCGLIAISVTVAVLTLLTLVASSLDTAARDRGEGNGSEGA